MTGRGSLRRLGAGIALFWLFLVAMAAPAAVAGQAYLSIEAVAPAAGASGPGAQQWALYLDGEFDRGAAERLAGLMAQQRISQARVYLNSPGGSLLAGMAIGRLLRQHRFQTHVGKRTADTLRPASGVCYSACPFAYAGGVKRFLEQGSVMGIHRVTNRVAVADEFAFEQVVSGQAMGYLTDMGIDPNVFVMMVKIPPGEIRLLTRDEAWQLDLVNDGEARPGSATRQQVGRLLDPTKVVACRGFSCWRLLAGCLYSPG